MQIQTRTELFIWIHLNNHILFFIDDSEIKSATEEPPEAESEIPTEPYLSAYLSFREVLNTKRCMMLYLFAHMWFTKIILVAWTILYPNRSKLVAKILESESKPQTFQVEMNLSLFVEWLCSFYIHYQVNSY